MKLMSSQEIRETWLRFFKNKGHHIEKSASLVPNNDPTLLWINAGVVALKKYFDGREIPPSRRIANLQKSIRTNDIDNVGRTARHHTFFEMMGNFSIGDYFRKDAIEFGFELLTSEEYFGMPKDKLYITYYPDDKESYDCWIKLGIDPSHLIPSKENFWEIGEGPCGPDTEIYFDRGEKYDPNNLGPKMIAEDIDNDRYIEIWNIVLSQFNAKANTPREQYKELPSKNIDTGAGLERFACILQGTESNFETDLFMPLIKAINKKTSINYSENTMSYRVIADHIKACVFALSDGALFSNEGRGYVLRRLLRRGVSHGHKLGIDKPFMYELVEQVVNIYSCFYPELKSHQELVTNMIKNEEEKFFKTLSNGEQLLKEMASQNYIDGFKLYDTYGFPIELSMELAADLNMKIDIEDFKKKMQEQKERARAARGVLQSMHSQSSALLEFSSPSEFIYENKYLKATVIGVFKNGEKVDSIDDEGELIFDKTNYYAEMGGQICDVGTATNKECQLTIDNVVKAPHQQHLHSVKVLFGAVKVGDSFTLKINKNRRRLIMRNHTAAHLLDSTLAKVLGENVSQKGSFVGDEYLRFDFNYNSKVSEETLQLIEDKINEQILNNIDVEIMVLPIEEAKKLGAKMVFTEKYGDIVRVVKIGDYSLEFCGGTHVQNTNEIGLFKIISEESISSGIRRITATTSAGALKLIKRREAFLANTRNLLNAKSNSEIEITIKALNRERDNLKCLLNESLLNLAKIKSKFVENEKQIINNHNVFVSNLGKCDRDVIVRVGNEIKTHFHDYLLFLAGENDDGSFNIYCTTDIQSVHAGNLLRTICQNFNGSGGGKPIEANGRLKSAIDMIKINELIRNVL